MDLNKKELKQLQIFGLTEEEINEIINMFSKIPRRINISEAKKKISSVIKELKAKRIEGGRMKKN